MEPTEKVDIREEFQHWYDREEADADEVGMENILDKIEEMVALTEQDFARKVLESLPKKRDESKKANTLALANHHNEGFNMCLAEVKESITKLL